MKVDANALRKEIKERGLTQKGLCKKLNVSPEHFNRRISQGDIPDHWYNLICQSGVADCDNYLGILIRRKRKEKKLTQIELAEKAGISLSAIRAYEQGKYRPKRNAMAKIQSVIGVIDPDEIEDIPVMERIRHTIILKRLEMGISQIKLAELSGLSIGTIQGYEQGKYMPKLDSALKLCSVLDMKVSDILSSDAMINYVNYFQNNNKAEKMSELSFVIREKRKERGLTQKELANMTGLAEIAIRQYEAGKFVPKFDAKQKLEAVLGPLDVGTIIYTSGEKIKKYRIEKCVTQQELADRIGVTQSLIGQWERGVRNPSGKTRMRISDALNIPIEALQSDWDALKGKNAEISMIEEYYNNLNAKGKALVIDILKMIASTTKYQKDVTLCQSDCDTMAP